MKRDGRGFDHQTLEAIRLMAVERVRGGERPSSVVTSFGFHRTTIYKWLKAASRPGVGLKALHARPATGRPRSLTPGQEQQVFRWINGRDPRQYGLDFGLWTRSVVADLIERKFNIRLGVTAVGALLAKLGLTPQKPLQRAYQRDPDAIEAWRLERFPAIARQAKTSGGEVYFWDEFGFRADTVHGKTWGKKGETPVVERPGQRQSISAASAVNARGAFWYCKIPTDFGSAKPASRKRSGPKLAEKTFETTGRDHFDLGAARSRQPRRRRAREVPLDLEAAGFISPGGALRLEPANGLFRDLEKHRREVGIHALIARRRRSCP